MQNLENRVGKTILVAEDEGHIARLVQVNLERVGYKVDYANNGQAAWLKLRDNPGKYDMLVTDLMMPVMDGFELTKRIRSGADERVNREIPIVMLTAKAQDADVFRGWQHGCDAYLTKPFNPVELITFVKRIFQGPEEEGERTYEL